MFEIISITDTGAEIATLQEAQTFFRSEEAENIEDALILDMVTGARQEIERLAGISLVPHSIVVYAEDWQGFLPYPLINAVMTVIEFKGLKMPYVEVTTGQEIAYTTLGRSDKDLKLAVLELAFYWYQRGGDDKSIPMKVKKVIDSYSLRRGI